MNNAISKIITLIIIFLFTSHVSTQDHPLPWIKVDGKDLIDENGQVVIFKGVNSSDPDKLETDSHWDLEYFQHIKSWGFNIVRFPIHPKAWRERGEEEYLKLIDKGIEICSQLGMYVILDWHSIGNLRSELFQHERYNTTKGETFKFWRLMAQRYGNNPNVAFFELFNEPTLYNHELGLCTWDQWKEIMEELIIIVRANGAKNIPLIAGFDWAYDLTPIAMKPISAPGVAYVSHPYPQKRPQPWEPHWESDWGFVSNTYPVLLTEIGFCAAGERGAHIPVISDPSYVTAIDGYASRKGISYCVWVFDPNWSPMLIEDWSFQPTKAGRYWKELLSEKID